MLLCFQTLFEIRFLKVAPILKKQMTLNGTIMIGYQPLDNNPNFFRIVFANSATKSSDLDFVLDEIERLGSHL